MSCPRTPTTTTSAATTKPNATPNEPYDASPGTLTVWATPSASTPSKPHRSPNAASLTAIFDAGGLRLSKVRMREANICWQNGPGGHMTHSPIRGTMDAGGICRTRNIEPDCGVVPSESPRKLVRAARWEYTRHGRTITSRNQSECAEHGDRHERRAQ